MKTHENLEYLPRVHIVPGNLGFILKIALRRIDKPSVYVVKLEQS
jgi:hypothetical protein